MREREGCAKVMVKLNKIYTRTGDSGETGLGVNVRVSKASLRVKAYGEVDEANSAIGVAVAEAERGGGEAGKKIAGVLRSVQHDLFDAGADLCVPVEAGEGSGERLRVTAGQTGRLEGLIDEHNAGLVALTSFVLPGGSALAASLHLARTITRRAERACVELMEAEPGGTSAEVVRYLNRLSDLLFVLGRVANGGGKEDVLWEAGRNR